MVHGHITPAGLWLEFAAGKGAPQQPKPVLWFKFWTKGELALLRTHYINYTVRFWTAGLPLPILGHSALCIPSCCQP